MTLRDMTRGIAGPAVLMAALAVGLVAVAVIAGGYDAGAAFSALWRGALGSPYAILSATLVRATPLVILGLAVALAFRAGVLNIGAEGQLLAGASAAITVGLILRAWPAWLLVPLELCAGLGAGAAWSAVAAVLKRRYGVLEVISTLMLNFVALHGVSYLVRGPLQERSRIYPLTESLGEAARLPGLVAGHRLHAGLIIAILLSIALWWGLRATAIGFRVRLVGAGPAAAESAGRVRVARVTFGVLVASGAIAGLAGSIEVTGVNFELSDPFSPGYGYTAIAVALLARLHPLYVVGSGVFFGALEAGAAAMQRDAGVPLVLVSVVEALLVLGVLAVDRARELATERGGGPARAPVVEAA